MTEDERMRLENAAALPWNEPMFNICPGRYFDRMCFITLPPAVVPPFGGDVASLVWRYEINPQEWFMIFRLRYNGGFNSDPFGPLDRKSWYAVRDQFTEDSRRRLNQVADWLGLLGRAFVGAPLDREYLIIEGDKQKFFDVALREKKSWMHVKIVRVPDKTDQPNP